MVLPKKIKFVARKYAEQINGREGETASLYNLVSLNSELSVAGFAPRHFNRWLFFGYSDGSSLLDALDSVCCFVHSTNSAYSFDVLTPCANVAITFNVLKTGKPLLMVSTYFSSSV